MARAGQGLLRALEQLASLVDEPTRPVIAEMADRLRDHRLRVLVVGEAKRGKSTLINALLGRQVLPSGVVPLTSLATTVAYGEHDDLDVRFADGRRESLPLQALEDLVTERGNPDNRRGVFAVTCRVRSPLLVQGIELVDTPGTGSVHDSNTDAATAALESMDAAIFVLTADPPISASEQEWLRRVRSQAVRVFVVLNKADYLSTGELNEALDFTRDVVSDALEYFVDVFPVSARRALAAGGDPAADDLQWRAFCGSLLPYLAGGGGGDLSTSIARRAARVASIVVERQEAVLSALSLSQQRLDESLEVFQRELDAVEERRFEDKALARATFARLLAQTADSGQQGVTTAAPVVRAAVTEYLAAALESSLRDLEENALQQAITRIQTIVGDWREAHTRHLTEELSRLDAKLRERLDEQVRRVRESAASIFDLALDPAPIAEPLSGRSRFTFSFGHEVGQADAIAATVRAHLPGNLGRRRVASYIESRSVDLLDQQFGRARADFSERLREAQREMLRALDTRFDAGAGHIGRAVSETAAQRRDHSIDVTQGRAAAMLRRDEAHQLAGELMGMVSADAETGA